MKPRAIIFDWDGTIVDSWRIIHQALNMTLEALGSAPWTEDEARQRIGPPARVLFTELFGEDQWQKADKIYIESYLKAIAGNIRTLDHIEEILRDLQEKKIYLAVVSTKRGPVLRQEASFLKFDGYFGRLVGAGDAAKDKPDAASVLLALEGSGIGPGPDVWFIGDGNTDMITARNAGATPILIETNPPSEESLSRNPPAYRFKTHAELKGFLSAQTSSAARPEKPRLDR